jgi:hypothetical protein
MRRFTLRRVLSVCMFVVCAPSAALASAAQHSTQRQLRTMRIMEHGACLLLSV